MGKHSGRKYLSPVDYIFSVRVRLGAQLSKAEASRFDSWIRISISVPKRLSSWRQWDDGVLKKFGLRARPSTNSIIIIVIVVG